MRISGLESIISATIVLSLCRTAPASAPLGSYPHGSIDRDGHTHYVYAGNDGHIYEIWLDGNQWPWNDLTILSRIPFSHIARVDDRPMSYVRGSGAPARTAVVYVDQYNHVIELSASPTAWTYQQLSNTTVSNSAPIGGYVRSDGVPVVAYIDNSQKHLHELSKYGGDWYDVDISAGANIVPNNSFYGLRPWTRFDGISSIPYGWEYDQNTEYAFESTYSNGSRTTNLINRYVFATYPAGYHGVNGESITISTEYGDGAFYGHIFRQEAPYGSLTWGAPTDITAAAGAGTSRYPSAGFIQRENRVAGGYAEAVVYADNYPSHHILELERVNGTWIRRDATSEARAPVPDDPIFQAYTRSDNVTAVPYQRGGHIYDLYTIGGLWYNEDLTVLARP